MTLQQNLSKRVVIHLSNAEKVELKRHQALPNGDIKLYYKVTIKHSKYSQDYVDGMLEETENLTFHDIYVRVNREGKITETNISGSVGVFNCFGS